MLVCRAERDGIDAVAVTLIRLQRQAEIPRHLAAEETADAVRLPVRRGHELIEGCTIRLSQDADHKLRFVPASDIGSFRIPWRPSAVPNLLNGAPQPVKSDSPVLKAGDPLAAWQLVPDQDESPQRPLRGASQQFLKTGERQRRILRLT